MIALNSSATGVETQSPAIAFDISRAIEQHLPLVQKIARTAYHKYGRHFDQEDLVGYGHLGLVSAAHKYAGLERGLRQAVSFSDYAHKRIWRTIETGRDRMALVGRTHYRLIKRGQMAKPKLFHESEDYRLAAALAFDGDDGSSPGAKYDFAAEMMAWLRQQNPLWAKVVEMHTERGMTLEQVGAELGRSRMAASSLYCRAVRMLRWKYNHAAYRHDDRTARRDASRQAK